MAYLDGTGVTTLSNELKSKFDSRYQKQADMSQYQPKLVSGTNIKTVNGTSLLGSGNIAVAGLPSVTASDNGKVLTVDNGAWAAVTPSGGGGGGINKLTLYTNNSMTNVWVDQARTTTLFETLDYDYSAAKTLFSSLDVIEIFRGDSRDRKYTVVSWYIDATDDTFEATIVIGRGSQAGTMLHTFSIYE